MVRANTGDEKAIRESLGVHLFRGRAETSLFSISLGFRGRHRA